MSNLLYINYTLINCLSEKNNASPSYLQIQCNTYQNSYEIFHKNRTILKFTWS